MTRVGRATDERRVRVSIEYARYLADKQGLTILRLPIGTGGLARRYAVLRTDLWMRYGIEAPYIKYRGLKTLIAALTPQRREAGA
jgi:hypothetical protein